DLLPVENFLPPGDRVDDTLAPLARIGRKADQVSLEIAGIIRQRRAIDVQFHARRARLTASRRRLFERTSRAGEARPGGKGSSGFEEPAARKRHAMRSGAILVREMFRVKAWSVRTSVTMCRKKLLRPCDHGRVADWAQDGMPGGPRSSMPYSAAIAASLPTSGGWLEGGGRVSAAAGSDSARRKFSRPAGSLTTRKRASADVTLKVCGMSRGP